MLTQMLEARSFANGIMVTDHLTLNKRDCVGATRNHKNLKHRKVRELWQKSTNQSSYGKGDTGKGRMTRSKFLKMMGISMRQTVWIWERTITIPTKEQQGWGTSVLEQHGPTCGWLQLIHPQRQQGRVGASEVNCDSDILSRRQAEPPHLWGNRVVGF